MQKVLITGGAGFIGSNLCEYLLSQGFFVICMDNLLTGSLNNIVNFKANSNFEFINHDVTKPLPDMIDVSYIFHLASPASPNYHSKFSYHALAMETMMVNTQGTLNLLNFAKKSKAKFLFASTSEVYGDPLIHPQHEEYNGNVSTTGPRSVYDESKRFGETLTFYFEKKEDVDARIARIFNTFGPRMMKEDMRMVITFITQALENKPITVYGDGTQTRSLCYIDDLIEGLVRLMFYPNTRGQIVNLGSDYEHSVFEYAKIIKKLTHSSSDIVFSETLPQDDPKKRRPDITKAKKLLNWEPKISLEEGLSRLIKYFQSQN